MDLLVGSAPTRGSLRLAGPDPNAGFETELSARASAYVAVQALEARGTVIASSKTVREV